MIPRNIPQITREAVESRVANLDISEPVYLVGLRGYYLNEMGVPGKNDRGIYDDAIILVGPNHFSTYNANTDPSYAFQTHLASLKPGLWQYKLGIHGLSRPLSDQYEALVQAGEVTVERDGEGPDTGFFGINIHRGGANSTSSLGCQTIAPSQWPTFIASVEDQMSRVGQKTIPYALIDDEARGRAEPASIRYKNPGAMWGGDHAKKWGAINAGKGVPLADGTGQGNTIAQFPTFVAGIAAQIALWRTSRYRNKKFKDAIIPWSGGNNVPSYIKLVAKHVPGFTGDAVIDDAFLQGPSGIPFLKAQAWHEAGKKYPAPDADWIEARRIVFAGAVPPPPDVEPTPAPQAEHWIVRLLKLLFWKRT